MKNETARKPAKILQFQVDFYERGRVVRSFSTVDTFIKEVKSLLETMKKATINTYDHWFDFSLVMFE